MAEIEEEDAPAAEGVVEALVGAVPHQAKHRPEAAVAIKTVAGAAGATVAATVVVSEEEIVAATEAATVAVDSVAAIVVGAEVVHLGSQAASSFLTSPRPSTSALRMAHKTPSCRRCVP